MICSGGGKEREGKEKRVKEKGKVGSLLSSRVLKQKPTACGGCGCGTLYHHIMFSPNPEKTLVIPLSLSLSLVSNSP